MLWRVGAYRIFAPLLCANEVFSCHLGNVILYDTVSKLGWSASSRTHGIRLVIEQILSQDWEPGAEGHQVPAFIEEEDCVVRLGLLSYHSKRWC